MLKYNLNVCNGVCLDHVCIFSLEIVQSHAFIDPARLDIGYWNDGDIIVWFGEEHDGLEQVQEIWFFLWTMYI